MINFSSMYYKQLALMLTPGILLILQSRGLFTYSEIWFYVSLFVLLIFYPVDILKTKQIKKWHLPALVMFIGEVGLLLEIISGSFSDSNFLYLLFGVFACGGFLYLFLSRRYISGHVVMAVAVVMTFHFVIIFIVSNMSFYLFLTRCIKWLLLILPFISGSFYFSKTMSGDAVTLPMVCVPLWIEMYLTPGALSEKLVQNLSLPSVELSMAVFRWLPPLIFYILIPYILQTFTNLRKKIILIILLSFISTGILTFILTYVFSSREYVEGFLFWLYSISSIFSPILISMFLLFGNKAMRNGCLEGTCE